MVATALAACASERPDPPADCAAVAQLGTTLAGAREAHRRGALRQKLREHEALEPGYTLRLTDAMTWRPNAACVADLAEAGRLLFERQLGAADGLVAPIARVQRARQVGARDSTSCTACHARGGPAGAGGLPDDSYLEGDGERVSSGDARNPPSLAGAGLVQALGEEMTRELAAARDRALATGDDTDLVAKGVGFGTLRVVHGHLDTRDVRGVDVDLVVRPFGWKGTTATLVEQVAESNALHFGITSAAARALHDPVALGDAAPTLTDGQITATAVYLATLDVPVTPAASRGAKIFDGLGCAGCHTPALPLVAPMVAVGSVRVPLPSGAVHLYSDLKRHDLGEANAALHHPGGIGARMYLTRRLWGAGETAPYFHDGESSTVDAAIARHAGEAQAARDAWDASTEADRSALRVFLDSLRRAPQLQVP